MKSIVTGVLASFATISLLASCGSDKKLAIPTATTDVAVDDSIPTDVTFPAGALPSDATVPDAMIDQMITELEKSGMTLDRDCFKKLLNDEALRNIVAAGGAPSQEAIQKVLTCLKA